MQEYIYLQSIGQDSHRFSDDMKRPLLLGGIVIPDEIGLAGNSDADVILHALTNALSGLSTVVILGPVTDEMCRNGITDSREYVRKALSTLGDIELLHLSFTVEGKKPKLYPYLSEIRSSIAELTGLSLESVAITATSGEDLTAFGRGEGIQVFCLASARYPL
ncbi:MAG: 2-C-methyl-D-erythritol 2,4-cyclodiphosphate synthase [Clostridiaceae bacterium]|jgi:2-C-methyl-D-erythritol 2,4-cyclodiphosphate synthase|nr:2-C-methyl-D-erythritol 2,4-cyclodiphosphate synthase [Clostridiaceae bacterium]